MRVITDILWRGHLCRNMLTADWNFQPITAHMGFNGWPWKNYLIKFFILTTYSQTLDPPALLWCSTKKFQNLQYILKPGGYWREAGGLKLSRYFTPINCLQENRSGGHFHHPSGSGYNDLPFSFHKKKSSMTNYYSLDRLFQPEP